MLSVYKSCENNFKFLPTECIENDSWVNLIKPSTEEIKKISEITNVSPDFLKAALDENEHSRIELESDCILIVINIPLMIDKNSFDTVPLGIILTKDYFITVCLKENKIIDYFSSETTKISISGRKTRFLFEIFLRTAELYLRYMRYINHLTDDIEKTLRKSMKNKSLFHLFEMERSLVYFITALKDNAVVTEKLLRIRKTKNYVDMLEFHEDDEDLLEDVIIENKQATEMVEMHSNILSSMMDANASIISNNLNMVMKFLTSVTILLAIPTMISSFWGMNVDVPWKSHSGGFVYVIIFAIINTGLAAVILWKKKMF
jgi:magnesium transporter